MDYENWPKPIDSLTDLDGNIKDVDTDGVTVKLTPEEFEEYDVRPLEDRKILEGSEFEGDMNVEVISREEWGARPPREIFPLEIPVKKVGINFNSHTDDCYTKEDCMRMCRQMQDRDMDKKGLPDIAYNFMVGGDGYVYEGRGWNSIPHVVLDNKDYEELGYEEMIDVVYIGDSESKYHAFSMYETFISWLQDHIYFDKKYVIEEFVYK